MYLFYVYVQRGKTPDGEQDQIYAKLLCSYSSAAEYVNYLNNRTSKYKYYFMRKSAYIDTDSIVERT